MNLVCAFKDVMLTIGGIVIAILILLLMITIHEFGHYIAGRKLGFKINEFAIGFGPKLLSKKNKHGIVISLRAFPLGGFCAFEDDEDIVGKYVEGGNERAKEEEQRNKTDDTVTNGDGANLLPAENLTVPVYPNPDDPTRSTTGTGPKFSEQKPWKRIIVLATGAIFNILSAIVFSFIMLLAFGNVYKTVAVQVAQVYNNDTKIEQQGEVVAKDDLPNPNFGILEKDDIILVVNGKRLSKIKNFDSAKLSGIIAEAPDVFKIEVKRNGEEQTITVKKWEYAFKETDKEITETDYKAGLGFSMYGVWKNDYNVLTALGDCVPYTFKLAGMVLSALGQLFTTCSGIKQMGGTVTTIKVIGKATTTNAANILLLLPLIAVNLGVFNLLPVPALDGCRILICCVEWIRRKPLNRKVEMWIHAIGFLVLIGFVIIADILQLFVFKQF